MSYNIPVPFFYVTWQKHIIGKLWRDNSFYYFGYYCWKDLVPVFEGGFFPLCSFPELKRTIDNPYVASYLWPTFAQVIPSKKRPDYKQLMDYFGITDPDDCFDWLLKTKRKILSDRLEVFFPFPSLDEYIL